MQDVYLQLWYKYHLGYINRKLTAEECNGIRACEYVMYHCIPEKALLEKCGGVVNLVNLLSIDDHEAIHRLARALANEFSVDEKMMFIRLQELYKTYLEQQKPKQDKHEKLKKRIFRKEGNVLFVKFD